MRSRRGAGQPRGRRRRPGLVGNEAGPEPDGLASLFQEAARAGLSITAHAGENGPPLSVWRALEDFHASRIGHGIQSIHDPGLVATLAARRIPLEVCPTSNLHTGAVPGLDAHPLAALRRAGAPVTLNSDDPAISQITLTGEYTLALVDLGLTLADLRDMILMAVDHAFLPPAEQAALQAELVPALDGVITCLKQQISYTRDCPEGCQSG